MKPENDVLTRIDERYQKMSKNHKKIAEYIQENIDQAVFMTAAKMGEALSISESTVVRFAAGLGYDGYPGFQKALEECVRGKLTDVQRTNIQYNRKTHSELFSSVLISDMERIKNTLETLDPQAFDAAVDTILKADTVYIMGLRSNEPLADFLYFYLSMIRGNVVLLRSTSISETFEQMIRIHEEDCFVGISFPRYSMRTLKAMEFANDRNAHVIAITDSVHSPMNLYSSCNLLASSDMMSIVDSLVAPLSVINALIVALCMKRPQDVKNHIKLLENTWNNYQVYINDEIDYIDEDAILGGVALRKA